MGIQNQFSRIDRNPKTHAEHRREVFWQITLPLLLGILVLLAGVGAIIFSAIQPVTDLERWADVSLMWMILPSLFIALLVLVILSGFVYAVSFVYRLIPRYARIVQLYFELGKSKISQLSNLTIEPIIRLDTLWARVRYVLSWLRNMPVSRD